MESSLAKFLISRSVANPILGNYLYWYLSVEKEDKKWTDVYGKVLDEFLNELLKVFIILLRARKKEKMN